MRGFVASDQRGSGAEHQDLPARFESSSPEDPVIMVRLLFRQTEMNSSWPQVPERLAY